MSVPSWEYVGNTAAEGWLVYVLVREAWDSNRILPVYQVVLGVFYDFSQAVEAAHKHMPGCDFAFEQIQRDHVSNRFLYLGSWQSFRLLACPAGFLRRSEVG